MPRTHRAWTMKTRCPTLGCDYIFEPYYATWTGRGMPFTKCPKCKAYIDTPLKPESLRRREKFKILVDTDDMPFGKYGPNRGDCRMMMDVPAEYFHYLWTAPKSPMCMKANRNAVANYIARNLERLKREYPDKSWEPKLDVSIVNTMLDVAWMMDRRRNETFMDNKAWLPRSKKTKPVAPAPTA